ncbi:MAG: hypothetical protein JWP29_687, partial [Rhodoferax sp.]|nr:hypothetical protein [Rhodoferax sp.]
MLKFRFSRLHQAASNAAGLALVGLLAASAPAHADPTLAFQGEPFGTETVTISNG